MARTGSDTTKKRILAVAEKLFAARGFDATSVDQIARSASVNKALIYYHFKNKHDLILELFRSILDEVASHTESRPEAQVRDDDESVRQELRGEIDFLQRRKRVLAVMLSEALKSSQRDDLLFQCAELVMQLEHGGELKGDGGDVRDRPAQLRLVHEFFTGFIPMVMFVALRDRWCSYFGHSPDQATDDFVEAFARSHLASQTDFESTKKR
ncbi:MAG: TetR/AcrR family transcriptional regulator [Holophagales bacterium]|nr:TetR/AcrR family transcriptional regulator [Holophagales bacterium]MBK9967579.1 TetR/AcrR family transcriptional regulator [Holophagales bacterium]